MSYKIKLGTFKKFVESTKQPNTSAWAEYDVVFKDGADIVNPIITLAIDYSTVSAYNYAYMLNRYYWITAKNMLRSGYCVLTLKTDVLATYKSAIGNSDLYILRSSAQSDGNINDALYPIKYDPLFSFDTIFSEPNSGVYVVTMAANSSGGSITYQFTSNEFSTFLNSLLGVYSTLDFSSAEKAIKSAMFKPLDYIYSCFYIPGSGFSGTTVNNIKVGLWDSGASGKLINNIVSTSLATITLQHHNQAATRGSYLDLNPYTFIELYAPPFGVFPLNAAKLGKESTLSARLYIDASTGIGRLVITTSTSVILDVSTQYGATVPLTQNAINPGAFGGIIDGALTAGVGVATGNPLAVIGGMNGMIGTIAGNIGGSATSYGMLGSRAKYGNIQLRYIFYPVVDEDNARNGRPLCQVKKPSTLTGYMIAQRGDVDISGTLPEEEEIRRYLESGFFYE